MNQFIGDLVASYAEAERTGFEAFRNTFAELNPRLDPAKPEREDEIPLLSWTNADLLLLVVKATFTVSLSALRTAGMFAALVMLEQSSDFTAWLIALLVVGSVELGIVIYAIYGAYRERLSYRNKEHLGVDRLWIAGSTIFALVLMIGANGLKSLPVLTLQDGVAVRAWLEQVMLVAMGVGVPMMAFIDGRFIGNALGAWLVHNRTIEQRYTQAVAEWQRSVEAGAAEYYQRVRSAWEASAQYQAMSLQFRAAQRAERRKQLPEDEQPRRLPGNKLQRTKLDIALEYYITNKNGWQSESDVPTARDVQKILEEQYQQSFPPASLQKARDRFIAEHL